MHQEKKKKKKKKGDQGPMVEALAISSKRMQNLTPQMMLTLRCRDKLNLPGMFHLQ
jgi:hypothetical protein